jgi:hypothetical protein
VLSAAAAGRPPPGAIAGCRGGALAAAARSAVSAIMADWTPGVARTAFSASSRTLSHAFTSAASTVMEKKTLPSLATISESLSVAVSGRPSGVGTLESFARTSSLSDAMPASAR